jgi:hypothetical protein
MPGEELSSYSFTSTRSSWLMHPAAQSSSGRMPSEYASHIAACPGPYDRTALHETTPALWLVVAAGGATALLSTIAGYVLLNLPLVRVKVRHDLRIDSDGQRVESYVRIANVRGRPVTIQEAFILRRSGKGRHRTNASLWRRHSETREPRVEGSVPWMR